MMTEPFIFNKKKFKKWSDRPMEQVYVGTKKQQALMFDAALTSTLKTHNRSYKSVLNSALKKGRQFKTV